MKLKESEEEDEDLDEETEETEEAEEGREARSVRRESVAAPETDNVGDPSVEINVEELIHEIEAEGEAHALVGSWRRNAGSKISWRGNARSAISKISTITTSSPPHGLVRPFRGNQAIAVSARLTGSRASA